MANELKINPWVRMWTEPKKTIRQIVKTNPKRGFYLLATFAFLSTFFGMARGYYTELNLSFLLALILAVIVAPLAGAIIFYFYGWILYITGRWLRGKASKLEIRALIAWASLPSAAFTLLYALYLFFFPHALFGPVSASGPAIFLAVAGVIAGIWSFVLFYATVEEVQHFSFLRTLSNLILYMLVFGAMAALLAVTVNIIIRI